MCGTSGRDRRFQREGGVALGVVQHHVDAAPALRRRSGEIDVDLVPSDRDSRHDHDRLLEPVAPDLVPVDPIREGADRLAQGALGAGDDLVGQRIDTLQSELVHHRQQRPPADVVAGGLGVEIADRLVRETDVGADDLQQLLVRLAPVEELRHRDTQPLLVDLVRLAREDLTADVRRVTEIAEVADDPALAENRRDHREVVELAGSHPGVVGDQHVAGTERLRGIGGQQVAHAGGHRVDVPGVPVSDCAIIWPRVSKTPQARSCDSRTTVLKAVRISAACCSLATERSRFQSTSSVTGSRVVVSLQAALSQPSSVASRSTLEHRISRVIPSPQAKNLVVRQRSHSRRDPSLRSG